MEESLNGLKRTCYCGQITQAQVGEVHTVMGWVQKQRNKGSLIFIDLRDRTGIVQAVLSEEETPGRIFDAAAQVRTEYVLAITGVVVKREGAVNDRLATGQVEIKVQDLHILSEAKTTPFQVLDEVEVKDELRLKYRYLDLRRPKLARNMELRHKTAQAIRQFLNAENFLEIETPMLIKSTPEGARDYLVPSRVHPGNFYALPQSPQMYKQLLMVAGMDRYYQIVRCFRDEDLRADRQPEFTQVDMEISFAEEDDVMEINERLIAQVCREVAGWEVPLPLRRMTWQEAMERYGSDKPDLRFDMEIVNVEDLAKKCGFSVFENAVASGGSVRGICAPGCASMPRKQIDSLTEVVKLFKAKGLAWIAIQQDGTIKSPIAKFLTEETIVDLQQRLKAGAGDLMLFVADQKEIALTALGNLRLELGKRLGLMDEQRHEFLWVTDFPMFEYSAEENRYLAMHHPFTMPKEEDLPYLETEPGRVRAKAYDIVLNGVELGGGSVRIHRRDIQERVFKSLGFTMEEAYEKFGFFIDAFTYGAPPHAGLAYGFDRMVMLMAGEENLRDVIAFPKIKDASCPMSQAPGKVDEKQLEELCLQIHLQKKQE
ncbi:MAG: aspartate--tRNA ligase [Lachnospiraceae bacterium]|jgi:aspartyl-tRNA synthetase|nr:aspartate--tRNA ligase [Lachnospiraceae bacterium]